MLQEERCLASETQSPALCNPAQDRRRHQLLWEAPMLLWEVSMLASLAKDTPDDTSMSPQKRARGQGRTCSCWRRRRRSSAAPGSAPAGGRALASAPQSCCWMCQVRTAVLGGKEHNLGFGFIPGGRNQEDEGSDPQPQVYRKHRPQLGRTSPLSSLHTPLLTAGTGLYPGPRSPLRCRNASRFSLRLSSWSSTNLRMVASSTCGTGAMRAGLQVSSGMEV